MAEYIHVTDACATHTLRHFTLLHRLACFFSKKLITDYLWIIVFDIFIELHFSIDFSLRVQKAKRVFCLEKYLSLGCSSSVQAESLFVCLIVAVTPCSFRDSKILTNSSACSWWGSNFSVIVVLNAERRVFCVERLLVFIRFFFRFIPSRQTPNWFCPWFFVGSFRNHRQKNVLGKVVNPIFFWCFFSYRWLSIVVTKIIPFSRMPFTSSFACRRRWRLRRSIDSTKNVITWTNL